MPEADRKLRVFLCHSSNDKPTVLELYHRLEAEGWIDAWLDSEKLYPGQDWNFEIEKAVEESDVILACLTKGSVNKEGYVQRELRIVLDLADYKPEGTLFVIPVRLEECEPPRRLRTWQYADYFPEEKRDTAYQRLLTSLKMRAKKLVISTVTAKEEKARLATLEKERLEVEEKKHKEPEEQERKEKEARERKAEIERVRKAADEQAKQKKARERITPESKTPQAEKTVDQHVIEYGIEPPVKPGDSFRPDKRPPYALYLGGAGILIMLIFLIFGANYLIRNVFAKETPAPTEVTSLFTATSTPTHSLPNETSVPPTPTLGIGSTMISAKDGMVLVYVPAGNFSMGSNTGDIDESPLHTVYLDAFWTDQTEVTNKMYRKCVDVGVCMPPSPTEWTNSHFRNDYYSDYPVVYVSWENANSYCSWVERRLPTEAEWEKVASWNEKTKEKYDFPWGNKFDCARGNFDDETQMNSTVVTGGENCDGYSQISLAGSFLSGASQYGSLDLAGNVWEWVLDWYEIDYFSRTISSNPQGPETGKYKVLRGGSWRDLEFESRSTNRARNIPELTSNNIGFRCAVSP
jgi:formylglycine-generating enzyme required for sulfatase activity